LGGTRVTGGKPDELALFYRFEADDVGPGQYGYQVEQRPGIFFKADLFEPSQGRQVEERSVLYFHGIAGAWFQKSIPKAAIHAVCLLFYRKYRLVFFGGSSGVHANHVSNASL
jgi:hypothetical protein